MRGSHGVCNCDILRRANVKADLYLLRGGSSEPSEPPLSTGMWCFAKSCSSKDASQITKQQHRRIAIGTPKHNCQFQSYSIQKRTPKTILQLYNVTWLHCCHFLTNPKHQSRSHLFRIYLHDLVAHAPPIYQLVCL